MTELNSANASMTLKTIQGHQNWHECFVWMYKIYMVWYRLSTCRALKTNYRELCAVLLTHVTSTPCLTETGQDFTFVFFPHGKEALFSLIDFRFEWARSNLHPILTQQTYFQSVSRFKWARSSLHPILTQQTYFHSVSRFKWARSSLYLILTQQTYFHSVSRFEWARSILHLSLNQQTYIHSLNGQGPAFISFWISCRDLLALWLFSDLNGQGPSSISVWISCRDLHALWLFSDLNGQGPTFISVRLSRLTSTPPFARPWTEWWRSAWWGATWPGSSHPPGFPAGLL